MLDHHIQKDILYRLAFATSLRFSELKPNDIENKLFDYHLKKVLLAGYVEKDAGGAYRLTHEGRRLAKGVQQSNQRFLTRAYSTIFLAVRRQKDDAWLLYKRLTHPMIDKHGFMHVQPSTEIPITKSAEKALADIGLSGSFTISAHGYFRVFEADLLESFTHFTLLRCDDANGDIINSEEYATFYWDNNPDWNSSIMLPTMSFLVDALKTDEVIFIDQTIRL